MATLSSSLLLVLFPLLIVFAPNKIIISANAAFEEVRDTEGRLVRSSDKYYILPATTQFSGGLTLGPNRNGSCPFDILQEQSEVENGTAVKFAPVNPKKGVIRVSTDVNIYFPDVFTICVQSTAWRLSFDGEINKYFVTISGVIGNPGRSTLSSWFKIETSSGFNNVYKLSFCPSVCNTCGRVICSDLGIFLDKNGVRRLTLSDDPLEVVLKKV